MATKSLFPKRSRPVWLRLVFCVFFVWAAPLFAAAQDPDIQQEYPGEGSMDEVFRTSELDGESPTSARGRRGKEQTKRVSVPKGAFRVGCICMDDTRSAVRSVGACSGHRGVRYWLYRTVEGDTVRVLTGNHERHPGPLDAAELSELAQKREKKTQNLTPFAAQQPVVPTIGPGAAAAPVVTYLPAPAAGDGPAWMWPLALVLSSVFLYLTVRFVLHWAEANQEFLRDALSDFLRHRKRPAARKSRKDAGTPRLP